MPAATASNRRFDLPDRVADGQRRLNRSDFDEYARTGILTMRVVITASLAESYYSD